MPKILAIDDINDNLISLKAIIHDAFPDATVFTALNGPKGIELALSADPDVILLDVIMPGMDGFEVCQLLKLNERTRDIPVVFLTALKGDKENRIKALEVGAEGFLSKPIDEPELIAQIRAMVKIKSTSELKRTDNERLEKMVEDRTRALQNELIERTKAEESLRESEERFREIFTISPDSIAISEIETGRYVEVNPKFEQLSGYRRDEIIGRSSAELGFWMDPNDREIFVATIKKIGVVDDQEMAFTIRNGSLIHTIISSRIIRLSGQSFMLNVIKDITERKLAEKVIKASEERFRHISSSISDISYSCKIDADGNSTIDWLYGATETITGYSVIDIFGMSCWGKLVVEEDLPIFRKHILGVLPGSSSTCQLRFKRKDGSIVWIEATAESANEPADAGFNIIYGGLVDISERKIAEEALKQSEAQFRQFFEKAADAIFIAEIESGIIVDANESASLLMLMSHDQIVGLHQTQLHLPFNEKLSRDTFNQHKLAIEQKISTVPVEYAILRSDGAMVPVEILAAEVVFDGKRCMLGIFRDISERKQAEQALWESQLNFKALFEKGPIGVAYHQMIYDETGKPIDYLFLDANQSYQKLTGVNPIGKRVTEAFPGIENDSFDWIGTFGEVAKTGKETHFEQYLTANKRWYDCVAYQYKPDHFVAAFFEITEKKQAETALNEINILNKYLLQSIPFGMHIVDEHGNIFFQNENMQKYFGDHIAKSKCWEIYHNDKCQSKDCLLLSGIQIGKTETCEIYGMLEGKTFEIVHTGMKFKGQKAMLEIFQDITDRKKMEMELLQAKSKTEKSEQQLILKNNELVERNRFIQTILDNLPIGLSLNRINEGTATYMNKKFEEIYGWAFREIISTDTFFEHVYPDPEYRNVVMTKIIDDIDSGDPERMHWENVYITRKDGSKRVVNAVNIPLFEQNIMVSTVIDITELHKIQNDLMISKDKAEQSDRLKSAFLANMSHEIRTPLNSIIGFSELMADPDFDPEQQLEFARMINDSGTNLLSIITDIMDLSKIEAGQLQVKKTLFSVSHLVADIQREYAYKAAKKDIELRFDPANPIDEMLIESDETKLRQVLINLIGNAIKFTKEGFVEIGIKVVNNRVRLQVKDTGIGIPAQYHKQVFERFRQVEPSDSRKYGGNGLGLAISKSLVEMLGGELQLESEAGNGSIFYFELPVN